MSNFIKEFEDNNIPQFDKFRNYIRDNDWSLDSKLHDREEEYKVHKGIVNTVLNRLEHFCKKAEGDLGTERGKKITDTMVKLLKIHTERVDYFLSNFDLSTLEDASAKTDNIAHQNTIYLETEKFKDRIDKLNLDEDRKDLSGIMFFEDEKAPLAMHDILCQIYPDIKRKVEEMGIDFETPPDNEFLILKDNVPEWNEDKHYFEQEKETLQFFVDEFKKLKRGIEIDSVYIHPWLYSHLNVFKTDIPMPVKNTFTGEIESKDVFMHPPLRDNEWYIIQESYRSAEKQQLMLFIAATRRLFKSTGIASHLQWKALTGGKELIMAGASAKDLGQVEKNLKKAIQGVHPAFRILNLTNDWTGKIPFGIKKKNQKSIPMCVLNVINLKAGGDKASEVLAGYTPDAFVLDEVMKAPFIDQLDGAKPSFDAPYGKRVTPILSGCVCAGTKVWNNNGDLVNIEDLKQEDGIVGYDGDKIIKQKIGWFKEPSKKQCLKITVQGGHSIECSEDHPFLSYTDKENSCTLTGVLAKDLKVGKKLIMPEEVPIFGKHYEKDARLLGMMIGDGNCSNQKSIQLSCSEKEIFEYMKSNYNVKVYKKFQTKEDNTFRQLGVNGIIPKLKESGIYGLVHKNKRLPSNIDLYDKESIAELLGGYFDADGNIKINKKRGHIRICLTSNVIELLEQVKYQLLKFGIHCTIGKEYRKDGYKPNTYINRLYISKIQDIIKFKNNIKFLIEKKQKVLDEIEIFKNTRTVGTKSNIFFKLGENKKGEFFEGKRINNVNRYTITNIEKIGEKEVYNLNAVGTNTYLANGFVTMNTGGNEELSADALTVLADPLNNDILPMNWDVLERNIPKNDITWKRAQFGTFAPAQMSAKVGMIKNEISLWEYLGVEKTQALDKIRINVTDWNNCNKIILKDREKLSKNRKSLIKETVYYPLDPEEIFLSGNVNPFPVEEAKRHRNKIIETGNIGKYVNIWRDSSLIKTEISNKQLPQFPFNGGNIDCPVHLFEEIPKEKPPYGLYCAGLDDYKQEKSDGDSLGSLYIMKRQILNDPFSNKIVASLTTRPKPHSKFHKEIHMLLDAFNAICLMENEDMGFKEYLDTKYFTDKYLQKSFSMAGDISLQSNGNRVYGLPPTQNKKTVIGMVVKYCNKKHNVTLEDGTQKEILGIELINDLGLLEEIIKYNEKGNFDRIVAFGHTLIQDHYLTSNYITFMEEPKVKKNPDEQKKKSTVHPMFGRTKGGFF